MTVLDCQGEREDGEQRACPKAVECNCRRSATPKNVLTDTVRVIVWGVRGIEIHELTCQKYICYIK
jgi:hypothetical protein